MAGQDLPGFYLLAADGGNVLMEGYSAFRLFSELKLKLKQAGHDRLSCKSINGQSSRNLDRESCKTAAALRLVMPSSFPRHQNA